MRLLLTLVSTFLTRHRDAVGACTEKNDRADRKSTFDIRQSVAHLPFQSFWTWLSMCPTPGQKPLIRVTPLMWVIGSIGGFIGFVGAAGALLDFSAWMTPAAALFLLPATGCARIMFITVEHQVIHHELFIIERTGLRRWCNWRIGDVIGILLWLPEPDLYHETHTESHHKNRDLATPHDKDAESFFRLGFLPGLPKSELWKTLWLTLLNPWFYVSEAAKRIRLSLVQSSWRRIISSWLLLAGLISLLFAYDGWIFFLAVYLATVFVGFPAAGVLQTASRHLWGCYMQLLGTKTRTALVCQARFLLDPWPPSGSSPWAYVRFVLRLVIYHLPVRIVVINGDVAMHDYHHRHPGTKQWTVAAYGRMEDIQAGCPGWEDVAPYVHCWSLFEAIDRVFDEMSKSPPLTEEWLVLIDMRKEDRDHGK